MTELEWGILSVVIGIFKLWFVRKYPSQSPYKFGGLHWTEIGAYFGGIAGTVVGTFMIIHAYFK